MLAQLRALWVLTHVLNKLNRDPKLISSDRDELVNLIRSYIPAAPERTSDIHLERGIATIPLNGIDVPFHSTYLRDGISAFRNFLEDTIMKENVDPEKLVGKFIPNVMGKPFSVDRTFVEDVAGITGSGVIRKLLDSVSFNLR